MAAWAMTLDTLLIAVYHGLAHVFGLGDFSLCHQILDHGQAFTGQFRSAHGGHAEPHVGFLQVRRYAVTIVIEGPQKELRVRIAGFCRLLGETRRRVVVMSDAVAGVVEPGQINLGWGVSLIGGEAIPARRLGGVGVNPFTSLIHDP